MKPDKPHWGIITGVSWCVIAGYVIAVVVMQLFANELKWHDAVRDTANALLAVALMLLSLRYSGILTQFHAKVTSFGITKVRVDRHGADEESTPLWLSRIQGADEVTIIGTQSRGWFIVAYDALKALLEKNVQPKMVQVFQLDPFGKVWRSKIESAQSDHKKFLRQANAVFSNLADFLDYQKDRVTLQLYDAEPLSCVIAGDEIYLALYLPRTGRKESPELTIARGSYLGEKMHDQSIQKLRDAAPPINVAVLRKYIAIMERHLSSTAEAFWNDPEVFCDFCKEKNGLPSEISRRYPELIDGSRIARPKIADQDSTTFFLVPSLGPLVQNHALIVTSDHVTSSAQLDTDALKELRSLLSKFSAAAQNAKREQIFFEHGVPFEGTGHGGCGICHCHVHALDIEPNLEIANALEAFLNDKKCGFERFTLGDWTMINQYKSKSYLCVQKNNDAPSIYVFKQGQRVESQLMRQFIAAKHPPSSAFTNNDWDWRKTGFEAFIASELENLDSRDRHRHVVSKIRKSAQHLAKVCS